MKVLLLHGLHSQPGGSKAEAIIKDGHELINPALPADNWDAALKIAQEAVHMYRPDVIVGSSRGGALAVNVKAFGAKRILIAPAWKKFGSTCVVPKNTIILHSENDDIVKFEDSIELSKNSSAKLISIGENHRMNSEEVLETMLRSL